MTSPDPLQTLSNAQVSCAEKANTVRALHQEIQALQLRLRSAEDDLQRSAEALKSAQRVVDESLPQCQVMKVDLRGQKEPTVFDHVVIVHQEGDALLVRSVGSSDGYQTYTLDRNTGHHVQAQPTLGYASLRFELRNVPHAFICLEDHLSTTPP